MHFKEEAISKLMVGARKVYDAVGVTLGPAGRLVTFENPMSVYPATTKDGVTVASIIFLEDKAENQGAYMMIQAARKQVKESGDGTTLTIVLAYEMMKAGLKAINAGVNPALLREGIDRCVADITTNLKENSAKATSKTIKEVATIATNGNKELGDMIANAVIKTGEHGIVMHDKTKDEKSNKHYVEYIKGYQWDQGIWYSDFFNKGVTLDVKNPYILVTDKPIVWGHDLAKVSEIVKQKPLIIIADYDENENNEAIASMVNNKKQGYKISIIKPGGLPNERKYRLADIAELTGATYISDESGIDLQEIEEGHLGRCDRLVSVFRNITTIFGGRAKHRIAQLKILLDNTNDKYEIDLIKKSIAKLSNGLAIVRVGGDSETEQQEIMDRVDDAIRSCRSAQEEGISEGGGVELLKIKTRILTPKQYEAGYRIVLDAIGKPIEKILENADRKSALIVEEISRRGRNGYDIKTGETVKKTMFSTGIVDPTKVLRTALLYSSSVVKMLLQTDVLIVKGEKKENPLDRKEGK